MTSLPSPSLFSFCARCCLTFSHNFILFFCCFSFHLPIRGTFLLWLAWLAQMSQKEFHDFENSQPVCRLVSVFFFSFSIICIPTMTMARWNMRNYYDYVNCSFVSSCLSRLPFFTLGKLLCTKKSTKTHSGELERLWNLNRRNQSSSSSRSITKRARKKGSWSWQLLSDDSRKIPRATATNLKRKSRRRWFVRRLFCFCCAS